MKKILIFILFSALHIIVFSRSFYFDNVSGDDLRTSTEAQNPNTPWRTISKANSLFSGSLGITIAGGDTIKFKRGSVWYNQTLVIAQSGSLSNPIVIQDYGNGNKPLFVGLKDINTTWTAKTGYPGVWEMSVGDAALGGSIPYVLINNEIQREGRWPNDTGLNRGYLHKQSGGFSKGATNAYFKSTSLSSAQNWTGASAIYRSNSYTLARVGIRSQSVDTIFLNTLPEVINGGDYGFFIQGHLNTLDLIGEWYYNPTTNKISMFYGSSAPVGVQVPITNTLIANTSGYDNIVVNNIDVEGSKSVAINFSPTYCDRVTVTNCTVNFSGGTGINIEGYSGRAEFDTVNYAFENAIRINAGGEPASLALGATISNNYLFHTNDILGMGALGSGRTAINAIRDYSTVTYNKIFHCGVIGIKYPFNNGEIAYNYIYNAVTTADDHGALYQKQVSDTITLHGNKIHHNIIEKVGYGVKAGKPDWNSRGSSAAFGIYLDDNINNVEVYNNVVSDVTGGGYYIHNNTDINFYNNISYNCAIGIRGTSDGIGREIARLNVHHNQFISRVTGDGKVNGYQYSCKYNHNPINPLSEWGIIDTNFITRPSAETEIGNDFVVQYNNCSSCAAYYYSLLKWQTNSIFDTYSKKSPMISPASDQLLLTNPTNATVTNSLSYAYTSLDNTIYNTGSITLQPFEGIFLMKSGSVVAPPPPPPSLANPIRIRRKFRIVTQ